MEQAKKWIERSKTAAKKKILIVGDNLISRGALGSILSPVYEASEAENSEEGLVFLKEQKIGLSLILLDIVMSVMGRHAFLPRVRADTGLALIPIVVTAQSSSEADEVAALSCSAVDFVSKPYRPEIILHRVANIINLGKTAAMANELQYDRLTELFSKEYFHCCVRNWLDAAPGKTYDIVYSNIENFYWQAIFF